LCIAPGPPPGGWEFGFAGRACRLNTQEAFWYLTGHAYWHKHAPPELYQPSVQTHNYHWTLNGYSRSVENSYCGVCSVSQVAAIVWTSERFEFQKTAGLNMLHESTGLFSMDYPVFQTSAVVFLYFVISRISAWRLFELTDTLDGHYMCF
jgi:hypothetical protein